MIAQHLLHNREWDGSCFVDHNQLRMGKLVDVLRLDVLQANVSNEGESNEGNLDCLPMSVEDVDPNDRTVESRIGGLHNFKIQMVLVRQSLHPCRGGRGQTERSRVWHKPFTRNSNSVPRFSGEGDVTKILE